MFLPQKELLERKLAMLQCESGDSDSEDGMKETGMKNMHGNDKLWHRSIWVLGKCDLYSMCKRILDRKIDQKQQNKEFTDFNPPWRRTIMQQCQSFSYV